MGIGQHVVLLESWSICLSVVALPYVHVGYLCLFIRVIFVYNIIATYAINIDFDVLECYAMLFCDKIPICFIKLLMSII